MENTPNFKSANTMQDKTSSMYFRFGVEGRGTSFARIGIIKADTIEDATSKMNEWEKTQTTEQLESWLAASDRYGDHTRPRVCFDYGPDVQMVVL